MGSIASNQPRPSTNSKEASSQLTDLSSVTLINQNPEQGQYSIHFQSEKKCRMKAQQLKASADKLRENNKYELALEQYKNCLAIYEELKAMNSVEVAAIFIYGICDIYVQQGQFQAALEVLKEAKIIYQKSGGDSYGTAASLQRIGLIYYLIAEYDLAIENYKKALTILQKTEGKNSIQVGSIINNIGLAYMDKSQYTLAMRFFKRNLQLQERINNINNMETANSHHNIGVIYWNQGEYLLALQHYQEALIIFQNNKGKNSVEVADTLVSIGVVLDDLEDFPQAIEMYKSSIAIYNKHRLWHLGYANAHENMGFTFQGMKDYGSAEAAYRISLPIYQQLGQTDLVKRSSLRLVRCLSRLGKKDQSQGIIRQYGVVRSEI